MEGGRGVKEKTIHAIPIDFSISEFVLDFICGCGAKVQTSAVYYQNENPTLDGQTISVCACCGAQYRLVMQAIPLTPEECQLVEQQEIPPPYDVFSEALPRWPTLAVPAMPSMHFVKKTINGETMMVEEPI